MRVGLLPMGDPPPELLSWLRDALASYGIACEIRPSMPLPEDAFDHGRAQHDAEAILAHLAPSPRDPIELAVTPRDLVSGRFEFVFGLANADKRVAVVSLNRLDARDPQLVRHRLLKEAVHELGHILGLGHCLDAGCVMHFSNSLADTDAKRATFCDGCESRLPQAVGPSVRKG